ncbi:MAG TPA: GNAT family N-acetyltransferase [Candidatus Saccharimonadales bacterium]|nr:GNAT family N-acetyltransferase [Candidatus Saccharimonadales bacterium]
MAARSAVPVRCVSEAGPRAESWERLLAHVPGAGPFHRPAWRQALCAALPGFADRTLWVPDGEELRAALPVVARRTALFARVASQPYGTPGGLWLRDPADLEAAAALVAEFARRHARPWNDCVVVDHGPPALAPVFESQWRGARCHPVETHRRELPASVDALDAGFTRKTRKEIRRGLRLGLRVEDCSGPAGVDEYAALQAGQLARRGGFAYPAALVRATVEGGWVRLHRVRLGEDTLAVIAVAEGGGVWFAWLMARAPETVSVPLGEVLIGELLRDAVRRGLRQADLGGSSGRESMHFFKERFGFESVGYRVWRSGPLAGRGRSS